MGRGREGDRLELKHSHTFGGKKFQESSAEEKLARQTGPTRSILQSGTWKVDLREQCPPAAGIGDNGG